MGGWGLCYFLLRLIFLPPAKFGCTAVSSADVCDYYLFDSKGKSGAVGGTGVSFDWKLVKKNKIEKPFFLSGGIGLEDVAKIKAFKHPDFFGIDINSKFEKEPGVKDMALVLQLKQAMK